MSTVEIWLTLIGLTGITFVTRNFFVVLGDLLPMPERLQHALRFAPACALAALVAPEVLTIQGAWAISLTNPRFVGGLAAIGAMLATRSLLATMAVGMGAFMLMRWWV
jgi:branched-subunit amino acid transport protein